MQPTNSQQALKELQTYQGGRKSSRDVLTEAETRLGVPTQQQRLTGLRSALGNTENLIRSVEPGVAGRTGGSYVTEAQRNRLVGIERAPLDEAFREQSRGLEGATADLGEMNRQALTEAQLRITDDDRRENELQKLYDTLYGREQADKVFAENQRQFNEQQRAASANANYLDKYFGGGQGGGGADNAPKSSTMQQRADKGFNFTDASGKAISAAQFAAAKGIPFRTLLQEMATAGDAGAKSALGFTGDDFGYDPRKITNQNVAQVYNALTWGSGRSATYTPPKPSVHNQVVSAAKTGFVTQPDVNTLRESYARAKGQR